MYFKVFITQFIFVVLGYSIFTIQIISRSTSEFSNLSNLDVGQYIILVLLIVIPVIFIAVSMASSKQLITMTLFWIFHLIFFGFTGFLSLIDPSPYYLTEIAAQNGFLKSTVLILIAEITAGIAQIWAMTRKTNLDPLLTINPPLDSLTLLKRVKWTIIIYLLATPITLASLGGSSFVTRSVRYSESQYQLPLYLESIAISLIQVPPLVCALILMNSSNRTHNSKIILGILLSWVLVLSNPLANARQTTLFLILPIIYFYLLKRKVITNLFFLLLIFFLLYGANLVDRFSGRLTKIGFSSISRSGDFDAFSQVANGITQVDRGGFPYMRQILGSALFFVPRSVWPSKPRDTGVEIADMMGLRFQNLSAPWVLEAYANLRIPGILAVGFILGYFLTKQDLIGKNNLRSMLLSSLFFGTLFIILRGSLLQATGKITFSVALILFLTRNSNLRKRPFY